MYKRHSYVYFSQKQYVAAHGQKAKRASSLLSPVGVIRGQRGSWPRSNHDKLLATRYRCAFNDEKRLLSELSSRKVIRDTLFLDCIFNAERRRWGHWPLTKKKIENSEYWVRLTDKELATWCRRRGQVAQQLGYSPSEWCRDSSSRLGTLSRTPVWAALSCKVQNRKSNK
jgi:hypothetical protein